MVFTLLPMWRIQKFPAYRVISLQIKRQIFQKLGRNINKIDSETLIYY